MARVCVSRALSARRRLQAGFGGIPPPAERVTEPLFSGTVYLANVEFASTGNRWSLSPADLSVVQEYLRQAAPLISRYASQYGANRVLVGSPLPRFVAPVTNGSYSDRDLQGWVSSMATANRLPAASAILVMNPPGVENRDAKETGGVGVLGYHGLSTIPYCFVNAIGSGFSLADHSDLFAEAVSHEVAEMTVDPRADDGNPEVCDGCGTNCRGTSAYRTFFDASGHYLGGDASFPPPFPYAFFLSAIARPSAASQCPVEGADCVYTPPGPMATP